MVAQKWALRMSRQHNTLRHSGALMWGNSVVACLGEHVLRGLCFVARITEAQYLQRMGSQFHPYNCKFLPKP